MQHCCVYVVFTIFATKLHLQDFMKHKHNRTGADVLGITSAILCTIHCLVIPALFLLKFWWTDNAVHTPPTWWGMIDYFFLVLSFVAVYHAASHAGSKMIKRSFWAFWLCLTIAIIFEQTLHWMAYIASAGLIATHFINIKQTLAKNKSGSMIAIEPLK
jgi:hypothetical protein